MIPGKVGEVLDKKGQEADGHQEAKSFSDEDQKGQEADGLQKVESFSDED
jgi:hypothetical protein